MYIFFIFFYVQVGKACQIKQKDTKSMPFLSAYKRELLHSLAVHKLNVARFCEQTIENLKIDHSAHC